MVAIEVVDRVVNMEVNKVTGMVMQCITELTNRVKIEVDKVVDMVVNMEVDKVVDKVAVMVDDRQKIQILVSAWATCSLSARRASKTEPSRSNGTKGHPAKSRDPTGPLTSSCNILPHYNMQYKTSFGRKKLY